MLALAEAFVSRGHDVTWLGQPSIEARATAAGCRFSPFRDIPNYEPRVAIEDQFSITMPVLTGPQIGEQLVAAATEQGCDLVVVDANLAGAAAAAETLGQPSAVLLHSMYATFTDTWFADFWPLLGTVINETRTGFCLRPCNSWPEVFAGHERIISAVPRRFDAPVAELPKTMRHWGFLLPTTNVGDRRGVHGDGDTPLVLVGLSTTYQEQEPLLQAILDALGGLEVRGIASTAGQVDRSALRCPANVVVQDFLDHASVLLDADVMVTHAGLGSVAAALSRGVPLVCTPIGRDQHLNAERVVSLGAGLGLGPNAQPTQIAEAIQAILSDHGYRDAAMRVADDSQRGGGPMAAVEDLESLSFP
jgi:UDP:flavonoid glycosyltransferase YjiC (YdhE family)